MSKILIFSFLIMLGAYAQKPDKVSAFYEFYSIDQAGQKLPADKRLQS